MKKPKKITVKFFLNKFLEPIYQNDVPNYPLYIQITYDRKNTQIKSYYGGFYPSLEYVEEHHNKLLYLEERLMKNAVSYELDKYGLEFQLRGLGRKYEYYAQSIHLLFSNYLKVRFKSILEQAQPKQFLDILNLEKSQVDFFVVYDASKRLFDNVEGLIRGSFQEEIDIYYAYKALYKEQLESEAYAFPILVDWLNGTHKAKLEKQFLEVFKNNNKVEIALNLINNIVKNNFNLVDEIVRARV